MNNRIINRNNNNSLTTQGSNNDKYYEIVKAGYMPYVITDLGKFSEQKCLKELERFNNFVKLLNF